MCCAQASTSCPHCFFHFHIFSFWCLCCIIFFLFFLLGVSVGIWSNTWTPQGHIHVNNNALLGQTTSQNIFKLRLHKAPLPVWETQEALAACSMSHIKVWSQSVTNTRSRQLGGLLGPHFVQETGTTFGVVCLPAGRTNNKKEHLKPIPCMIFCLAMTDCICTIRTRAPKDRQSPRTLAYRDWGTYHLGWIGSSSSLCNISTQIYEK